MSRLPFQVESSCPTFWALEWHYTGDMSWYFFVVYFSVGVSRASVDTVVSSKWPKSLILGELPIDECRVRTTYSLHQAFQCGILQHERIKNLLCLFANVQQNCEMERQRKRDKEVLKQSPCKRNGFKKQTQTWPQTKVTGKLLRFVVCVSGFAASVSRLLALIGIIHR